MEFVKERSNPSPATFYAAFAVGILILVLSLRRRQARQLVGPPASSWLYGVSKDIFSSPEPGDLYADWAKVYGKVYQIPLAFGAKSMVLCDPKALAAFFSKDTSTYQQAGVTRVIFAKNFGQNVLTSELEDHKRQRRALSSGFSIAAIRDLTSVFYGSAYSAKASWDSIIQREATGYAVIDVQQWMNDISYAPLPSDCTEIVSHIGIRLDSIGIGGFSHDFGSTKGKTSEVAACFEALNNLKPSFGLMVRFVLVPILPILAKLPNKRNELVKRLSKSFRSIAVELLERARTEKVGDDRADKSILSVLSEFHINGRHMLTVDASDDQLVRSENASAKVQMDVDEIIAQVGQALGTLHQKNLFMLAGYETTATAMTWALIELSRHPEMQRKLRAELSRFGQSDPTYEQLGTEFPYLEAVTLETLRLHPSLSEVSRESHEDDILPLSEPIVDSYGKTIDRLLIPKGTKMRIPLAGINRLESLWGSDSHVFKPERWLDNGISKEKAAELQGYRHLLTFADGPRTCLGKLFAVTEFKSVLSVLIRNYSFELPNGPDTKIERRRALLPRPKVAGEEGTRVPLIVKRVE